MRLGELVIDIEPLRRSGAFRRVFAAQTLSVVGASLTNVGINLQVYQLTKSSLQVGLVGLVFGVTLLAGLIAGGVLADRSDRRKVILGSRAGTALILTGLAVNAALPAPSLGFVYVAAVFAGGIAGLGGSALMAAIPALSGPKLVAAAGALITVTSQFGAMVGPALAGLIASGPGIAVCFALDAAGYVVGLTLLWFLPSLPPGESSDTTQHPLRSLADGFKFIKGNQVVAGLLLIDLWAVVFAMPYALFPQLGTEVFHGGPTAVGLLYTAPAVGAFLGALTSGWTGRIQHTGRALIAAVLLWGLAITAFGLSGQLWLGLTFLALAGLGDTISEILRRALLQHYTPDRLQGRVGSLWLAQATGGTAVGNAEAGVVSRLLGGPAAVVTGGLVCVAGVVMMAVAMPKFREASLRTPSADELKV
ncbi:MFS transporter, ENTS family, enterobactin (siderophore) exporter [Amycolatopsis xylanica]|uniref:MFS transporter, ENTS family, enterobactin (Siderophore) exporter n=1 Tax=Amycolatopsis xylanica TaxID=589385 RepID=A0A1H2TH66_9PSEU|nr:enterobactin transporter EntS [Amycolatopsis xylanica]SDW43261.1 MFS transporter, ENTS family, enterobactin (siderophore) exporter [Amycolatopsis xylanica]